MHSHGRRNRHLTDTRARLISLSRFLASRCIHYHFDAAPAPALTSPPPIIIPFAGSTGKKKRSPCVCTGICLHPSNMWNNPAFLPAECISHAPVLTFPPLGGQNQSTERNELANELGWRMAWAEKSAPPSRPARFRCCRRLSLPPLFNVAKFLSRARGP